MTDEQIVKALEHCIKNKNCDGCPYDYPSDCFNDLKRDAAELIKRQQEDIELLKIDNGLMTTKAFEMAINKAVADKVRAEAIKEFADKLKEKAVDVGICDAQGNSFGGATVVFVGDIDNIVKEMVGADNGKL